MNVAAFFSYVVLTAITPGPNNIMSMANAGKYGFKKAFPFNVGVLLGFLVVLSCCAVLTSVFYELVPAIQPVMLGVGAAYILWLAWSVWRNRPRKEKAGLSQTNSVLSGMVLQFVNVKVILYGVTVLSSFVLPHYNGVAALAGFVVLLSLMGFAGTCCWSLFGAAVEKFFKRYAKLLNAVMALLLVYCAVTMLLEIWK